jgi:hypothetical protein
MLRKILRVLALVVMGVAAVFGVPLVPDPPPRNRIVQVDEKGPPPPPKI